MPNTTTYRIREAMAKCPHVIDATTELAFLCGAHAATEQFLQNLNDMSAHFKTQQTPDGIIADVASGIVDYGIAVVVLNQKPPMENIMP